MGLKDKALALRAIEPLVLANAWDAASAVVIAKAGARAIATTSGGVAWSLGRADGQVLPRAEMAEQVRRIAAAVDVPVTADVEGGYGASPEDVAATIEAVVGAGAVGVNLEDSTAPGGPLFAIDDQAVRVAAARAAAVKAGLPELLINVRTDVFLFGIGEPGGRVDEVLTRATAYADAGADSLFVRGLVELDVVAELVRRSPLPINVMAGPGAPKIAEFLEVGVRRVSVGTSIAQAAYSVASRAARELLEHGTYAELDHTNDYGTLKRLLQPLNPRGTANKEVRQAQTFY